MTQKLLYSIEETAAALSIGRSTVYKLIWADDLRPVKIGRRTLIPVEEIQRLLNSRRIDVT